MLINRSTVGNQAKQARFPVTARRSRSNPHGGLTIPGFTGFRLASRSDGQHHQIGVTRMPPDIDGPGEAAAASTSRRALIRSTPTPAGQDTSTRTPLVIGAAHRMAGSRPSSGHTLAPANPGR